MIKQIGKHNILISPFAAVKAWELDNVQNQDVVLLEEFSSSVEIPDTAVALDYIDYTSGSGVINTDCDIALEQQDADAAKYEEGVSGSGLFNIESEEQNADGTYKRLVYDQTYRSFYNQYRNPTQIFGLDNIDFGLSRINRFIGNEFLLFSIPRKIMGDKLVAGTIKMYDTTMDDNIEIRDDTFGNLIIGHNLFSKIQEIRNISNIIVDGTSYYCSGSPPIPPPPTSSTISPQICNWTTVLSQFDIGSGGTCDASGYPAWDGVFNLSSSWSSGYPLYYFLSQSISGKAVAANDAPDYPSGDWQNMDSFAQLYWNGSNWNLWLSCANSGVFWDGLSDTTDINDPSGIYTNDNGGDSSNPTTITIVLDPSDCPAETELIVIKDDESPSAIMTDANTNIKYINGVYYAFTARFGQTDRILTSSDGYNWSFTLTSMDDGNMDIAYDGTTYVIVTKNQSMNTGVNGIVYTSTDAITWTRVDTGGGSSNNGNYRNIEYANGVFVITGDETSQYSTDGTTWIETSNIGVVENLRFLNDRFIACNVNPSGGVKYSTDGINWFDTGLVGEYYGCSFGNGKYIVVGFGVYATSTDGITWSYETPLFDIPSPNTNLWDIAFGDNKWFMTTDDYKIYKSVDDGINWSFYRMAASLPSHIIRGNGIFIATEGS